MPENVNTPTDNLDRQKPSLQFERGGATAPVKSVDPFIHDGFKEMGLDPSWIQIIPVSPPKSTDVGDQRGGRRGKTC